MSKVNEKFYGHVFIYTFSLIFFIILVLYVFSANHKENPTTKHKNIFLKFGMTDETIKSLKKDDISWFYGETNTCVGSLINNDCNSYDSLCPKNIFDECYKIKEAIDNGGIHPLCPLLY